MKDTEVFYKILHKPTGKYVGRVNFGKIELNAHGTKFYEMRDITSKIKASTVVTVRYEVSEMQTILEDFVKITYDIKERDRKSLL